VVSSTSVLIVEHREVLRLGLASMVASFPQLDRYHCLPTLRQVDELPSDADPFDVSIASVEVYAESDSTGLPVPAPRTIALIESSSSYDLEAAAKIRADGYLLLAETSADTLRAAVDDVLAGQTLLPPVLSAHLLDRARRPDSVLASRSIRLSPREAEVLELVVGGLSNKEIARQLDISIHGAKRHVSSVLNKFNAPSRSYLISQILQLRPDTMARP
jgi:two-component system, NarL family, nitrate/nitrite response regulator NarL